MRLKNYSTLTLRLAVKLYEQFLGELGRIQNHLLCVGAAALDLGAFTGFLYGFNEREHIYDIMDYIVAGQRFHPDYTRVGGLMYDLPCEETFQKMVHNFIDVRMPKCSWRHRITV